jgi:hypothetical protein
LSRGLLHFKLSFRLDLPSVLLLDLFREGLARILILVLVVVHRPLLCVCVGEGALKITGL